jgi:haloalkane dehalogenase
MLGKNASAVTLKAYADPFPTPESRKGPAIFPVQIVAATPWLEQIESRLSLLAGKPVEFIFGLKDLLSTPSEIGKWLKHFPNAGVQKIEGANHFTQEDCPDNYVIAIKRIADKLDKRN